MSTVIVFEVERHEQLRKVSQVVLPNDQFEPHYPCLTLPETIFHNHMVKWAFESG